MSRSTLCPRWRSIRPRMLHPRTHDPRKRCFARSSVHAAWAMMHKDVEERAHLMCSVPALLSPGEE